MIIISKNNYESAIKEVNKELKNVNFIMMDRLSLECERADAELDDNILNIKFYIDDNEIINRDVYKHINKKGLKVGDLHIDTSKDEVLVVKINKDMDALEFNVCTVYRNEEFAVYQKHNKIS